MSANKNYTSSCEGKERFDTYSQAASVLKQVLRRHKSSTVAYRCDKCGGFHIGSQIKRRTEFEVQYRHKREMEA